MKYVIKNCPAYDYDKKSNYHICKQSLVPYESSVDDCRKCTDCVMKRIVGLCKEQKTIECNIDGKKQVLKAYYHTHLGDKILELLEIEEVNE